MKTLPLAALFVFSLVSCKTAPPPDPTESFRLSLTREIELGAGAEGPAAAKYRSVYGIDGLLRKSGARHRLAFAGKTGSRIGLQYFLPSGGTKPRGTVFLIPGYLDHSGSYVPFLGRLLTAGFAAAACDLPGHGFSEGERASVGSFEEYGAMVGTVLAFAAEEEAEGRPAFPRPWYALGHSTGATAFYIYLADAAKEGRTASFDRVVFIAPLVRSANWRLTLFGLRVLGGLCRYFTPRTEPDPLLGNTFFPIAWAERLRDWNEKAVSGGRFRQPGLIVQGLDDDVVNYEFNVPFLEGKMEGMKTIYIKGAGHVPYSEKGWNLWLFETVLAYLIES